MHPTNNELHEFNTGRKNQTRINQATGYVFITCPDYTHSNGRYTFKGMNDGLPLSFSLSLPALKTLSETKQVSIYLSDHSIHRIEKHQALHMDSESISAKIYGSLEEIKKHFPQAGLLSSLYSYEQVSSAKETVPEDYSMTLAMIRMSEFGKSQIELKDQHKKKYAEIKVLFEICQERNLCPLFLYSKFNLNMVSAIRKLIPIPVLFLEADDPH